jgi:hypothetical protein
MRKVIVKRAVKRVKYDAIICNQNNQSFYIAVIPSDILKDNTFVSRRDEDPIKGFQRTLNEARAKDIANIWMS